MQEQGFDKFSLTSAKQYDLITKLSGLEGINKLMSFANIKADINHLIK
jgi:hypothetical protein